LCREYFWCSHPWFYFVYPAGLILRPEVCFGGLCCQQSVEMRLTICKGLMRSSPEIQGAFLLTLA
jgi:hypothetical protein